MKHWVWLTGEVVTGLLLGAALSVPTALASSSPNGEAIYQKACAACHGPRGRGNPRHAVGFETPLPDFSDCDFASREPNADWVAVAHEGGPVRAFSPMMPAFGEALSVAELRAAMSHIRTFCADKSWPRGEFNLPRAQVTTKAFPEDEVVWETRIPDGETDAVFNDLIYEQRFGARNQFEIVVPIGWRENTHPMADDQWRSGLGDIKLGLKRVLYDNMERGAIISGIAEVSLPTGDDADGFGADTAIFEGSLAYGQILPANSFFQGQIGVDVPREGDKANEEAYLRLAAGRSFFFDRWGRPWTPMLELVASRENAPSADTEWDAVPQLQIMLSKRQHVRLNIGWRMALTNDDIRDDQFLVYLLWDWFDGSLAEGW
ncbi:cytochrome c, class I [Kineobactrum sediminis]|uniref:Cytochrome c, class I n=1 Tax=Kineobactrum sediminis TaxID=1905677 RepID=A0A2N5Y7F5_9GAMM|nr:c-type cytochrome [Kineobactrum sediminis]PLW84320.1 cytochrome c, class I [Kineobactrum sediminis]